jgi:glycerol-3-phosphate cytidylyltransferase-like family protein
MLQDIAQLKFPPRKQNERDFFTITLPKNKILKFTKTLVASPVDPEAEGEQEWTFEFKYDIVALPIREQKLREAHQKEEENQRRRMMEIARLKQEKEREKVEKIKEEISSLSQAEELRSAGEN